MTFQSRISRTKKRLSRDYWSITAIVFGIFGLIVILTFGLRAVTITSVHGVVPLEIPVVEAPVADPGFHGYQEASRDTLSQHTPAVVLTSDAFYFGDLSAFTVNFVDVRDKYVVRHIEGAPQLQALLSQLSNWLHERSQRDHVPLGKVVILVPAGDVPLPIVTQVVAGLRTSPFFERVILSTGLM